jgi:hypothetical protein
MERGGGGGGGSEDGSTTLYKPPRHPHADEDLEEETTTGAQYIYLPPPHRTTPSSWCCNAQTQRTSTTLCYILASILVLILIVVGVSLLVAVQNIDSRLPGYLDVMDKLTYMADGLAQPDQETARQRLENFASQLEAMNITQMASTAQTIMTDLTDILDAIQTSRGKRVPTGFIPVYSDALKNSLASTTPKPVPNPHVRGVKPRPPKP